MTEEQKTELAKVQRLLNEIRAATQGSGMYVRHKVSLLEKVDQISQCITSVLREDMS